MTISLLAGKPAPKEMLVDLSQLEREYFECRPDLDDPAQRVTFGTSLTWPIGSGAPEFSRHK